jgi:hypothetical protein
VSNAHDVSARIWSIPEQSLCERVLRVWPAKRFAMVGLAVTVGSEVAGLAVGFMLGFAVGFADGFMAGMPVEGDAEGPDTEPEV